MQNMKEPLSIASAVSSMGTATIPAAFYQEGGNDLLPLIASGGLKATEGPDEKVGPI